MFKAISWSNKGYMMAKNGHFTPEICANYEKMAKTMHFLFIYLGLYGPTMSVNEVSTPKSHKLKKIYSIFTIKNCMAYL